MAKIKHNNNKIRVTDMKADVPGFAYCWIKSSTGSCMLGLLFTLLFTWTSNSITWIIIKCSFFLCNRIFHTTNCAACCILNFTYNLHEIQKWNKIEKSHKKHSQILKLNKISTNINLYFLLLGNVCSHIFNIFKSIIAIK